MDDEIDDQIVLVIEHLDENEEVDDEDRDQDDVIALDEVDVHDNEIHDDYDVATHDDEVDELLNNDV